MTWPQRREDVDISRLARYRFTENITNRFCGTCSTLMFHESQKLPSKLGVYSGCLKNIDVDLIRIARHIYVGDTIDGGASVWFRRPNADGKEIPRYLERDGEAIPWDWPHATTVSTEGSFEIIPIRCHCKGIDLLLHRGDYATREKQNRPWFIDPKTHKMGAGFDTCDSCRLQFGSDIVNWSFADLANISRADGGAFPKTTAELKAAVDAGDTVLGTLTYYQSSPDVQRYFCRVCSAAAFYACDDRPDMVNVATGLLEAPSGARAEEFLSWNLGDKIPWAEDTKGGWREGLVKRMRTDAEEFRIARNYPKSWRRLEKEAKAGSS